MMNILFRDIVISATGAPCVVVNITSSRATNRISSHKSSEINVASLWNETTVCFFFPIPFCGVVGGGGERIMS